MNESWWESPCNFLCKYWWALLAAMILLLTTYFTRDYWLPVLSPPTPIPMATIRPTDVTFPTLAATNTPQGSVTPELGTGDVQITLTWSGLNDLDLYVTDPFGEEIFYQHPQAESGGVLDLDSNLGCERNVTSTPIENIFWPVGDAPSGSYSVAIRYYGTCDSYSTTDYTVRLLVDGQVSEFTGTITYQGEVQRVTSFER